MREGLGNGFPVKLLLIGLLISEFLGLGFDGSEEDEEEDLALLLLKVIESKLNCVGCKRVLNERKWK
jgi:hypothetical protein